MHLKCIQAASLAFLNICGALAISSSSPFLGAHSVNLWRLSRERHTKEPALFTSQDDSQAAFDAQVRYTEFPEQWFEQPLDHFSDDPHTFKQRYWFSKRHYQKGGPVIILDSGEVDGVDRLPFLDTGILEILTKATNGLGVILEHRYYGESIPVANFSTDSLRWLNNAQAAADSANFMTRVKFDGIDEDLTAPDTPWIYYGGSYAGARSAHMRVLYPDLVFGAIASSGVTHAALELWEYMDVIRRAADPGCSRRLETSINVIDNILLNVPRLRRPLKALFGLAGLEHDDDFADVLSSPLGSWQAKNWDPEVGSDTFKRFCAALAHSFGGKSDERSIALPGGLEVPITVLNYANYIKKNYVSKCPQESTVEDCFGSRDDKKYQNTSLSETWRAWTFQVCTEWGYFITAPPAEDVPRIVSRLITLESSSRICHQAYPPGEHFSVPFLPNITAVNVLGDFSIAADRLAIIDGEVDPWRPATPHSEYAHVRPDILSRPFKLIPDGVHHYDENGLRNMDNEPFEILNIHKEEIAFVTTWLEDWNRTERQKWT
ncbi:MGSCP1 [Sanghuangporus vaninii]